jgi:hypothetical protein
VIDDQVNHQAPSLGNLSEVSPTAETRVYYGVVLRVEARVYPVEWTEERQNVYTVENVAKLVG